MSEAHPGPRAPASGPEMGSGGAAPEEHGAKLILGRRAPASGPEMGSGGAAPEKHGAKLILGPRAPASGPEMGSGGAAPEEHGAKLILGPRAPASGPEMGSGGAAPEQGRRGREQPADPVERAHRASLVSRSSATCSRSNGSAPPHRPIPARTPARRRCRGRARPGCCAPTSWWRPARRLSRITGLLRVIVFAVRHRQGGARRRLPHRERDAEHRLRAAPRRRAVRHARAVVHVVPAPPRTTARGRGRGGGARHQRRADRHDGRRDRAHGGGLPLRSVDLRALQHLNTEGGADPRPVAPRRHDAHAGLPAADLLLRRHGSAVTRTSTPAGGSSPRRGARSFPT